MQRNSKQRIRLKVFPSTIFTQIPKCAQDVWSLNQLYMYLFKKITKFLEKKKKKLNISLFNHTYIFLHMAITLFNNSY